MTLDSRAKQIIRYGLDPIAFIREVLDLEVKQFHKEWIENFEKNRFFCLLAPRGHGKTFIVGAYIIWRIIKNPRIRVLVVTINQDRASEMMHFIQHQLLYNEKVVNLFGNLKRGTDWSLDKIRVSREGEKPSPNPDPTLKVLGIDSRMIGGHYDLIILDDIVDQQNTRTEYRRQGIISWYNNTLSPMLEPDGKIIDVGTSWNRGDIHRYLINKAGYKYKIYKAIIKEDKENNEYQVLWKERWSYKDLMRKKKEIGNTNFAMQYQNEFLSSEDAPIRYEWIQYYDDLPTHLRKYMGVDLASESLKGDYFVIIVIGIDSNGDIYVIDMVRTKASMYKQFELIKEKDRQWSPIRIGIESVAGQKMVADELTKSTTLPIIPIKSSIAYTRSDRVMRLSVLFESKRIFINPNLTELVDELIEYPKSRHDDCFKEDVLIKTRQGYKKIKDIKIGDEVFTHKHRYRKVVRTIKKPYDGIFHERKFTGQLNLDLSSDHKIYTALHYYGNNKSPLKKWSKREFIESNKWKKSYRNIIPVIKLGENDNTILKESDFYLKNKYDTTDIKTVKLDAEFAYILGLFLAEGHVSKSKNSNGNSNYLITFAFHENENKLINRVKNYFSERGIKTNVVHRKDNHCKIIEIHNKLYWHIFKECYDEDKEKQLPYYHHHLGKDLRNTLLGWLDGDGWKLKSKRVRYNLYGQSTSKKLALSMRDIALSIGWYATIYKRQVYRYGVRNKDAYTVRIKYKRTKQCHLRDIGNSEIGGYSYGVKAYHYKGFVYDLTVDEDNSFIADGMVVHNCVDSLSFAIQSSESVKTIDWKRAADVVKTKSFDVHVI